jgi:hypothetical protein
VRQQHPDWTNATKIAEEAERQYNAGSQLFFTETLRTAKILRPKGKFGFYEYPMAASPELTWLWSEVGVMAGSQCAHPVFRCLSCLSALRFLRAQRVVLPFLPAASHCADIIFAIAHHCIIALLYHGRYGRTAASTAASVNSSITAVKLAETAASAAGKPFIRPDIMTYIWLWPGAKPVSEEQLSASVRTPAAMGADGVFMWGSSSDAHVSGYSKTITDFLTSTVGPLFEKCIADRAQCAAALCNGHGRCSDWDPAHPEKGCEPPEDASTVTCLCDAGWKGAKCESPA